MHVKTQLILGDCLEVMKEIEPGTVDVVITDPPYSDYYVEDYKYFDGILEPLKRFDCPQLIFWSAKADFPMDYTAIHIWDKKTGVGSMYERVFERNGGKSYRVFRHYLINSTVAANYAKDTYTGHPSQKPNGLMRELVEKFTKPGQTILDPFMGSGSTGVACKQLGRNFIGIELDPHYFEIAKARINTTQEMML